MGKTIMDHPMTKALIKVFRKDMKLEIRKMKGFMELYINDKIKKFSKNIVRSPVLKEGGIGIESKNGMSLYNLHPPKLRPSVSNDKQMVINELKEVLKLRYIE